MSSPVWSSEPVLDVDDSSCLAVKISVGVCANQLVAHLNKNPITRRPLAFGDSPNVQFIHTHNSTLLGSSLLQSSLLCYRSVHSNCCTLTHSLALLHLLTSSLPLSLSLSTSLSLPLPPTRFAFRFNFISSFQLTRTVFDFFALHRCPSPLAATFANSAQLLPPPPFRPLWS
jgi:hypothetical protein